MVEQQPATISYPLARGGRGTAIKHMSVGMTAFLTGWAVCAIAGTQAWGAAGAIALALMASGALAVRYARRESGRRRTGGEAVLGIVTVLVLAPLWGVRPLFADENGVARGLPVSVSAESVWVPAAVLVSLTTLVLMVPLARVLGRPAPDGAVRPAPHLLVPRRRWPAIMFAAAGMISSLAFAFLCIEAMWSDQIAATASSQVLLPTGPLPVRCPAETLSQYMVDRRMMAQPPGTRPFADSVNSMRRRGLVEGSVGLLVTQREQCDRVVDTDPWIETFIFRFDSPAHALSAYQAGLFGVVPAADPRRQTATNDELGSSNNLHAAWTNYAEGGSQSQFTSYWPYENYLVFFRCRNVDHYTCEHLTHPMAPNYYEGTSIQDRIANAIAPLRWYHAG